MHTFYEIILKKKKNNHNNLNLFYKNVINNLRCYTISKYSIVWKC